MVGVHAWWRHLTTLLQRTWRVWLAVLPKVIFFWVAGWLIYQLSLSLTAPLQEDYPWLTIIIFSSGLIAQLAAIIIGIRLAGEPAGLWDVLPESAARIGRDEPLLRVVSISLLPFVGVYSVFGGIQDATYTMFIYGARESSVVFNPQAATVILDPTTAQQRLTIGLVLVAAYLLRRGLEATADRTGWSLFGLLGALVEGFFSVVLIFGGSRMLGDLGEWLRSRVFYAWLTDFFAGIGDWLAGLHIAIPEFISTAWGFLSGTLWPLALDSVMQPLLWLAVAGLVFGTYTLSIAELWERGRERGISGSLARISKRVEAIERRGLGASEGSRKVTLEFFEVFVGDLEDRIVPFIQSMRYVLKVGVPFLGAYVLLYSLAQLIAPGVYLIAREIIGGNNFNVWFRILPPIDLLGGIIGEPIRVSLLAVAMTLTLAANKNMEADQDAVDQRSPGAFRAPIPSEGGHRIRRAVPLTLVTIASLLASAGLVRLSDASTSFDSKRIPANTAGEIMAGQTIEVVGLHSGQRVTVDGKLQPGLVTDEVFLGIDLEFVSHNRPLHSLGCQLYAPSGRDWIVVDSAYDESVVLPQLGFVSRQRLVFERPADGLVGNQLRCRPVTFYTSYEPMAILDLGIDEALAVELGAGSGTLDVPEEELEVIG